MRSQGIKRKKPKGRRQGGCRGREETPDIQSLDIYYRRLLSTQLNETMRFKIASFLAANGKLEEAQSQIKMLAPEDRAGFGPAHIWMVQSMVASKDAAALNSRSFRHHIERALELLPEDPVALYLGSQLRFRTGQTRRASSYSKSSQETAELNLAAAQVHKQLRE